MTTFALSLIRTIVPIAVGAILGWLAVIGLNIDDEGREALAIFIAGVLSAAYYSAIRWIGQKYPGVEILLGSRQSPDTYSKGKHLAELTDENPPNRLGAVGLIVAMVFVLSLATPTGAKADVGGYFYSGHVQDVGWQGNEMDGVASGTTGQSKRLEALQFIWLGQEARGHVQDAGWQPWQPGQNWVGTTGQSKRLEAVQVKSTRDEFLIECQAHVQNIGWMPRVGDGQVCGTTGKGLRLEAVRFWLVQK